MSKANISPVMFLPSYTDMSDVDVPVNCGALYPSGGVLCLDNNAIYNPISNLNMTIVLGLVSGNNYGFTAATGYTQYTMGNNVGTGYFPIMGGAITWTGCKPPSWWALGPGKTGVSVNERFGGFGYTWGSTSAYGVISSSGDTTGKIMTLDIVNNLRTRTSKRVAVVLSNASNNGGPSTASIESVTQTSLGSGALISTTTFNPPCAATNGAANGVKSSVNAAIAVLPVIPNVKLSITVRCKSSSTGSYNNSAGLVFEN